ncbi:MAG: dTMP kinase [Bifidobacteriaceae bacterium]|jgi:dTMP kinase|nr:dTMP kinase [Bifidobacteriaceae bacterium]
MGCSTDHGALAGRFIALEGGDGAGKSTHLKMLAQALRGAGYVDQPGCPRLVVTREPGGTELGNQIRELVLYGGEVAPAAEALLYAADRAQHVTTVLRPALARADLVLTDRYLDSSIAYQAEGRGLTEDVIRSINAVATGGLTPDLVIVLDIEPEAATTRRHGSGDPADRVEQAGEAFHSKVNRRYRELAAADPDRYVMVDATGPKEEVHERIWAAVRKLAAAGPRRPPDNSIPSATDKPSCSVSGGGIFAPAAGIESEAVTQEVPRAEGRGQ